MTRFENALDRVCRLGISAQELSDYQDEPPQMPSGSIGKSAYLRLEFMKRGKRSILSRMERRVPFLVQRALYWDEALPQMPCVIIISTSGCILQGDRLAMEVHVTPYACAHITTQSATKIHAMQNNYAAQQQILTLAEGSYLEIMPDPVIPHSGSRFINDTHITIHPTATLLYGEILMSGRKYHPEDGGFLFDVYVSKLQASRDDGTNLFSEHYAIEPQKKVLKNIGIMGPFHVFGNVILLTPAVYHQEIIDRVSPCYDENVGIAYGISRLPNDCGLIFKALGYEAHQVKAAIDDFWLIVREVVLGVGLPKPFWR